MRHPNAVHQTEARPSLLDFILYMRMFTIICFIILGSTVAQICDAQGTTTFLSNIGQASGGNVSVGSDSWFAGFFQTGYDSSGYLLDSIQLGMANSTGSPSSFKVMLYANEFPPAGFIPANSLAAFMGPLNPSASGTYTYTLPEAIMLSPVSAYYIVVTANTPIASGAYQWNYSTENNYNPNDGFGAGGFFQSNNGTTWNLGANEDLEFALVGSVAPEPGVVGLLAVGGAALIWWTKKARSAVVPAVRD